MPLPIAPLIMAGSQLIGGATNSIAQGSQNRASRRFATQQYNTQRQDNLEFWRMQNDYNSPASQMQRFKSAGLNPALMYGGSASGAAGNAGSLSAPTTQTPQFKSSNPGDSVAGAGLAYINALYDLDMKQAQTNNFKQQNEVLKNESALKAAQVQNTLTGTARSKFDLDLASELRSTSADAARANLQKTQNDTLMSLAENERRAILHKPTLEAAMQTVFNMREQTAQIRQARKNMELDGTLKQYEVDLRKLGIVPGGPWWSAIVGRLITQYIESNSSPFKKY